MKGLRVSVYKNGRGGDCSNGGVSSRCDDLTLVGPGIPEIFEADEDAPAVRLVTREIFGREYVHAEPLDGRRDGAVGWMAGGAFIYTSDGRFPMRYPISLHDRQEDQ